MAAGHSVGPGRWQAAVDEQLGRVELRLGRVETRRRFAALLRGMLAELPRRPAGRSPSTPGTALRTPCSTSSTGRCGTLRDYVIAYLGEPDGVLVVDETGDLKKGERTVGGQRQYTGTAGTDRGRPGRGLPRLLFPGRDAMIDRELYLPAPGPPTQIAARRPRYRENYWQR